MQKHKERIICLNVRKRNFYINGKWVSPRKQNDIQVINPATEKSCAIISLGGKEDIHSAVMAAKEAFKTWGFSTKEERVSLLETFYTLYKKRWNDITDAIIQEMGAPKDFASKLQTGCLLYTSPSPRDRLLSRMPSSA